MVGGQYGIISAFRSNYDLETNMKRTKQIKAILKALYPKVGFIAIQGSYQEKASDIPQNEVSFFVYTLKDHRFDLRGEFIKLGNKFEQDSITWCSEIIEESGKVYAKFSLICTTPNPDGVDIYDFFGILHKDCKIGQLIGKSELVSLGSGINPNAKEFQQAYSKIHGRKFFFINLHR